MAYMSQSVLLLHGFTNTSRSWDAVIAQLPDHYRPIAPDIRGHGAASAARPVTLDAVIEDIAAVTPEPFTLVGYSMGGRIGLHAAFRLHDRVRRLVLIGASPGLKDAVARAERRASDCNLAEQADGQPLREFIEQWARSPVLTGQTDAVRAAVDADRLRNEPAGLAAALRGLGTGALPSLWPRLGDLEIPVDLIVGERDAKFGAIAEQMADALPHARVTVAPHAGHAVHWESPAAVADVIAERAVRRS